MSNQICYKTATEERTIAVDFSDKLETSPDETLTGTPTVTATPSGLTFSSIAVNTVARTVCGTTAAIGKAVQCKVTGGTAGVMYTITVTVPSTTGTPSQILQDANNRLLVT